MSTPVKTVEAFVAAFIAAWPLGDTTRLMPFFREDAVYHNMPLEPVQGHDAIRTTLAEFMAMGGRVEVEIVHMVAHGPIVMTERVDHFIGSEWILSMPVMGVFEVHDGVITEWRDYFDLTQFTSQIPDGV